MFGKRYSPQRLRRLAFNRWLIPETGTHESIHPVHTLENLTELKGELDVRLYAYCLMTNHVHLLLMPAQGQTLASLLKALAGRQTRYVNRVEGRSGTLWEGRYKSSPVDTESYLLECSRYIELNPPRAGIVGRPEQYRWS